jgi:hypothetical protein
MENV